MTLRRTHGSLRVVQLRTPPRAPKGPPPLAQWRARRRLRRSAPRPPARGLFERPLARWRLRREFGRAARDSRAPVGSRLAAAVAAPFRGWSSRPRGPLFRGKLDRNLALIAIVVLGGGVTALVLRSGSSAPTSSLGTVGANPATPAAVPVVSLTPTPTPAPSVHTSPAKHPTSKPATSHSTKAVKTTAPAPVISTVPVVPPPQTKPPKPSPSPTHTPSPTSSPSSSPSPSPTPTPSLTTPPIPG